MLEESLQVVEATRAFGAAGAGGAAPKSQRSSARDGKDGTVYQCDQCEKKYFRWSHLVRHSRNHSSEKRYKCKVCSKTFYRVDVMKRHVQKHERRQQPRQPAPPASLTQNPAASPTRKSNRVSRACKACALAKIRCSEEKPCRNCVDKGLNCAVEASPMWAPNVLTKEATEEELEMEIHNKITRSLSGSSERGKTLRAPLCTPWGFAPLVWPPDEEDGLMGTSNLGFINGDAMQRIQTQQDGDGHEMIEHDPDKDRWERGGWDVITREIGTISGILRLSGPHMPYDGLQNGLQN